MNTLHAALLLLFVAACDGTPGSAARKTAAPSAVVESQAGGTGPPLVRLPPATEARLGIEVAKVAEQPLRRTRGYAGEVVASPDGEVVLRAPVGGTVHAAAAWPKAGAKVQGTLLLLVPRLSIDRAHPTPAEHAAMAKSEIDLATARIAAEGELVQARRRADAAKVAADRAAELLASGADSQQLVDDAALRLALAEDDVAMAEAKVALFGGRAAERDGAAATETPAALAIGSAAESLLARLHVVEGQEVAAGEPLASLLPLAARFVSVAVPSRELDELDLAAPAAVRALGAAADAPAVAAPPFEGPPRADAGGLAVVRWFELPATAFALGERVVVSLERREGGAHLVVPASALLRDARGLAWVYVRRADGAYAREVVDVRAVEGGVAWLERGPAASSEVVTVGAAELYGIETGAGK